MFYARTVGANVSFGVFNRCFVANVSSGVYARTVVANVSFGVFTLSFVANVSSVV